MGNCFGSSTSATTTDERPPKRQKQEDHDQKYVTDQVRKLRNQADTYHQKVVNCAKESQQAYQKGDKKKAKDLSDEKKKWQTKQDNANKQAASTILDAQKWQTSGEIDLHGLFLEEALDATKKFLKHWSKKATASRTVLVITGAGHHSENNKAVIRPKVEQLLRKERLEFESVHGNGAFQVHIKPSQ